MPLTRAPVDLETLCREVLDGFRSTHPERMLRFHSRGELTGNWDAARLRQVVTNLMGNALHHGSAQGPVELTVGNERSTAVLSVHNDGKPIPSEQLATIFDPLVRFTTPEAAAQRAPGSVGLGLYIVREIVVAHGGTVEVTSTASEGTTFTVRLPLLRPVGGGQRRVEATAAG
jgi:signal transduction histidine kinase